MVIVLSRFRVANCMEGAVKTAFLEGPHLIEGSSGLLRPEILSPRDQPEKT